MYHRSGSIISISIHTAIFIFAIALYIQRLNISSVIATIGGGFFAGALIGYALKKVIKALAIVVGLFLAALAYFQYQQILNVNWDKLQATSQNTLSTLANSTMQIPEFDNNHTQVLSNLGIPLTGSMAIVTLIGVLPSSIWNTLESVDNVGLFLFLD